MKSKNNGEFHKETKNVLEVQPFVGCITPARCKIHSDPRSKVGVGWSRCCSAFPIWLLLGLNSSV